jgi:hypothetical protein
MKGRWGHTGRQQTEVFADLQWTAISLFQDHRDAAVSRKNKQFDLVTVSNLSVLAIRVSMLNQKARHSKRSGLN